jgi:hypothetical protein
MDMDPSRFFKCRALVVEDDPIVLHTTAAIVRSFGFRFGPRRMGSLPSRFFAKFYRILSSPI